MRSIVTVTTPATERALTTLERLKLELDIDSGDNDKLLQLKIDEASEDIEAALNVPVARETVSETYWHEGLFDSPEFLVLNRTPVASIDSVTVDGTVIDTSLYRVDDKTGQLYALDANGYPFFWYFIKSIVVAYSGGYILPGATDANLPKAIEGGCIDLVSSFWQSRGRDPLVKGEELPGVYRVDYWVGATGDPDRLPPGVLAKINPFRRATA